MNPTESRRTLLRAISGVSLGLWIRPGATQAANPDFSYPMGVPGQPLGDGFLIRHGYATENVPYYPGWWHTGENWFLAGGETFGLPVYAVAAGDVVFAGYDYPGPVVIVQHAADLYSMYGHLDYALAVAVGQSVVRGQQLGTVLRRSDDPERSHLHFELRTFYTLPEINGDHPQYGVNCGYECPPGPGYWPMGAPEHPSQLGWRNPTHVINRRAWPQGVPEGTEVVVTATAPGSTPLWSAPLDRNGGAQQGVLPLLAGDRYPLLSIDAGAEDTTGTSAEAYLLWYRIALPDGDSAWVEAAVPDNHDVGSDGRPSSVRFDFVPNVPTPDA
jgi:murein DD-endopeptidase MepM/ murein hydrolase activator NlpD